MLRISTLNSFIGSEKWVLEVCLHGLLKFVNVYCWWALKKQTIPLLALLWHGWSWTMITEHWHNRFIICSQSKKGPHLFPVQNRAKTCESEINLYLVYNTTTMSTPSQFCSGDKWDESDTPPRHIPTHKHKIRWVNLNLKWTMLNNLRLLGLTTVE